VEESALRRLLVAVDKLDLDAVIELCSPDCSIATVDGRNGEGRDQVRQLLADFFSVLRSTAHAVTAEWHQDNVWIAEVLADYELQDWLRIEAMPRAFVIRTGPGGIRDIRVYGAREHPLTEHEPGDQPFRMGGRLVLPL
jgi:hypothetical protein